MPTNPSRRSLSLLLLASIPVLSIPPHARAQGRKADYERADTLRDRARDKVFRDRVDPHWLAGGDRFWYRNDGPGGTREFILVDAVAGKRGPAFDHDKLAPALGAALKKAIKPDQLPVDRVAFEDDGAILVQADDKAWRFDPADGSLKPSSKPVPTPTAPAPRRRRNDDRPRQESPRRPDSPDGRWLAFVREHDLFLREKATGKESRLTTGATSADGYEEGVIWSPDSRRLVGLRKAKGDDRKVYLIESTPRDQLQPKLHSYDYLKPGDKVPVRKPHLFDVAAGKEIPVKDDLFPNPFELGEVRWSRDSSRFTFLYNQRGHQVLRLVAVDAATGSARALIDETSPTFVDYAHKSFLHHLDKTDEILWMSERDGWNHLYLIDARVGSVKNPITKGLWVVRGVERVDEEKREVWFQAVGARPGQDPYYVHHARASFDGSGPTWLTEGDGTHQVEHSPGGRFVVDTYSRVDQPPTVELRKAADGSLVTVLERADASALVATGWKPPERFTAKGRDGKTDIYGVIYRPTNFDPSKRYPVIEQIYAGPQGAFVPKGFAAVHGAQPLAELGFVVVQIDGMGTNWRSRAFHDVCWKNLADAGLPDRILWMKAAAAKYPQLDLSRVGVYGGSAGGQNAMGALLFHPEFYKVGAADCGCHDNRMDKIWWNEAWMGWPVGPHYAEQSNTVNAAKLQGKLLLFVGELDRNVDPASTMQVVDALIRADKDFDLVVIPGGGHGAGGGTYGQRRLRDFFVRHLLGVEPRG